MKQQSAEDDFDTRNSGGTRRMKPMMIFQTDMNNSWDGTFRFYFR